MAQMHIHAEWDFRFTNEESKVLVKALIGRLKTPQDIEEAQRLADFITLTRAKRLEEQAQVYRDMVSECSCG